MKRAIAQKAHEYKESILKFTFSPSSLFLKQIFDHMEERIVMS